jgi:OOP family OmpA-OmpF porin
VSVSLLVRFAHDKANVTEQYFKDIEAVAEFMKKHSDATVVLEGHTSSIGDAQYNQVLSKKRADAVAKQLVKLGVADSRISTVGFGEERLLNKAYRKSAHAENRRVEANITTTEKVKVKRQ